MKHNTRNMLKKAAAASILTAALGTVGKFTGKPLSKGWHLGVFVGVLGIQSLISVPAYAISESDIVSYTASMSHAANGQNIAQISKLIADDAIISLSRNGKTTSLDKEGYLQLLQRSWAKASNYRYEIDATNIVIAGGQARTQLMTTETWIEDGKPVTIKTASRATLSQVGQSAVLLRSVAQVTVD